MLSLRSRLVLRGDNQPRVSLHAASDPYRFVLLTEVWPVSGDV